MTAARRGGKRVSYIRVQASIKDGSATGRRRPRQRFINRHPTRTRSGPQLEAALQYLREGDVLVVRSMDRLARNLDDDLRKVVTDLTGRGVVSTLSRNT
jgi:hypothetical protein